MGEGENGCESLARSFVEDQEGHLGSIRFVFSIVSTMMGTTIMSVQWGFVNAGLITGIVVTMMIGMACFYTNNLILLWGLSPTTQVADFSDLCENYLGKFAKHLANCTSIAIMTGAMTIYHSLMSETLQGVLTSAGADIMFCCGDGNYQFMVSSIIIGFCMFPLMSFRDVGKIAAVGSFGVVSVLYNVSFLVVMAILALTKIPPNAHGNSIKMRGTWSEVGGFVGMMSLSLFVQSVLLPIAGAHSLARTAPQKVKRDLGVAYLLAVLFYVFIGAVPAVAFELGRDVLKCYTGLQGDTLPQNMLQLYSHSWGGLIGRVLLMFQVGVVYPVLGLIMRKQFFGGFFNREWPGWRLVTIYNLTAIGFTTLVSAVFPQPGVVVNYVGTYTAIVYILWLPILVHLSASRRTGQRRCVRRINECTHVLFACLATFCVLMQFFKWF